MKNRFRILASGAGLAYIAMASNASAALDWTGVELNTTDVESLMAKVIIALATLWGFRKIVKTMNRS